MPYIIVSRAHMKKVTENQEVQRVLFEGLPTKDIRMLGVWENGFRHITNNRRLIVKPEDLRGVKLRVPSGIWRVKMFKAYRASPSACHAPKCIQRSSRVLWTARRTPCSRSGRPSSTRFRNFSP